MKEIVPTRRNASLIRSDVGTFPNVSERPISDRFGTRWNELVSVISDRKTVPKASERIRGSPYGAI